MTDEDPDVVAAWFEKREPEHPIAILRDRSFEHALGVKGFPTVGVIDPDGKLVYAGFRGREESYVEEGAERSEKGELWPEKLLDKALELVAEGENAEAYERISKDLEKADDDFERGWAQRYKTYLEDRAKTALARARELVDEEGRVLRATELLEQYAEADPPFPSSEESAAYLRELETLPDYDDELRGGKKFEEALELEKEREFKDAAEDYVSIYEKYEGTKIAEAARKRAEDLVRRGMPGFRASCPSCAEVRRACEKHAESVKL